MSEVRSTLFKASQLRELYAVLGSLSEEEQLALARLYADGGTGTKRLLERFEKSRTIIDGYPLDLEPFHPRSPETEADFLASSRGDSVRKTHHIAARLARSGLQRVDGDRDLGFRYVDREIFALRHTAKDGWRPPERNIDLLLADEQGFPIVGEVKIAGDKPTFYALIQALMYATELGSRRQQERLRVIYGQFGGLPPPDRGPYLDVYIVAFKAPEGGAFRDAAFAASSEIARLLAASPLVNSVVRRIAYIEAIEDGDGLRFEEKSFG